MTIKEIIMFVLTLGWYKPKREPSAAELRRYIRKTKRIQYVGRWGDKDHLVELFLRSEKYFKKMPSKMWLVTGDAELYNKLYENTFSNYGGVQDYLEDREGLRVEAIRAFL